MDKIENTGQIQSENIAMWLWNGKERKSQRKLQVVKSQTSPMQLFKLMIELPEQFPANQFRAVWQNDAYKGIRSNLPANHAVCVHDSENYRCMEKNKYDLHTSN